MLYCICHLLSLNNLPLSRTQYRLRLTCEIVFQQCPYQLGNVSTVFSAAVWEIGIIMVIMRHYSRGCMYFHLVIWSCTYVCMHLLQNMTVFGYFFLWRRCLLQDAGINLVPIAFAVTMYLMFGFSGDAKMRYGSVIPMGTVITRMVSCVTVAVNAIILTADGMRLQIILNENRHHEM